jgi:signal transduction histidine kinase
MVERCVEVGGVLAVESPAGGGTRIRAELPLGAELPR